MRGKNKRKVAVSVLALLAVASLILAPGTAAHPDPEEYNGSSEMNTTENAMVMNENTDVLPPGCDEIRGEKKITVRAGTRYASPFPDKTFTYNNRTYHVEPCTKLTVEFANEDHVRHQWMVHGLPTKVYPMGMFTVEVTGPGKKSGTFITPSESDTLLVHCGITQHAQKGMRAQIKVGGSEENIEGIPGISTVEKPNRDSGSFPSVPVSDELILGLIFGLVAGGMFVGILKMQNSD